jgi:hypothetical protein
MEFKANMDKKGGRTQWIKIRVTNDEKQEIYDKAILAGCTVTDLIRQSLCRVKTWTAKDKEVERERIREIRRLGQNLNQVAKWCNSHKSAADAMQVLVLLAVIERNLQKLLSPCSTQADATSKKSRGTGNAH